MFINYMDLLFREWDDTFPESEEFDQAIQALCNEGFENSRVQSRRQEIMITTVGIEKRNAFRGGFACAVQLMMDNPGKLSEKA